MCLNELLDQVKAQAGAPVAAGRAHIHLLKGPEDLAELVPGDAEPSVLHGKEDPLAVLAGAPTDCNGAIAGEFGCKKSTNKTDQS